MLDSDLAQLYGVETKVLNKAVKRNGDRFPQDFMFQLTREDSELLRCQFGTSKTKATTGSSRRGGRRYLPYAFTEQGDAQVKVVFDAIRELMAPPSTPKRPIGFAP